MDPILDLARDIIFGLLKMRHVALVQSTKGNMLELLEILAALVFIPVSPLLLVRAE